jgi:hypothetical protein
MHLLGVTRVLHMLEDDSGRDVDQDYLTNPLLLASLRSDDMCTKLLALPVLSPQCSWTRGTIYAFMAYVKFLEREVCLVKAQYTHMRICLVGATHACHLHNTRHSGVNSLSLASVGRDVCRQRIHLWRRCHMAP